MEAKRNIRKLAKETRSRMTDEEIATKSERICQTIWKNSSVQKTKQLLVYASIRKEVDLTTLVEYAWKRGIQVCFPKVFGEDMEFYEIKDWQGLAEGAFGVREPIETAKPVCPDEDAVICVPGVAFSVLGERIGYGKGYYDRYLSRYPKLYRIGVGYACQLYESWEAHTLDVGMQLLITEEREIVL